MASTARMRVPLDEDENLEIDADNLSVGFIGSGKMANALSSGFIKTGLVKEHNVINRVGVKSTAHNQEVVRESRVVFISVKPHIVSTVLEEISPIFAQDKLLVSVAAGVKIADIEKKLPHGSRVIRVMPNTPSLVQCGASVLARGTHATDEDASLVTSLLSGVGSCDTIPEKYLDAVTGLSGSGPAYAFIAIEALADGGVRQGLPRPLAQKLAAQTLMGAAKMVLETGKHPGELKDAVCSPGGTTIAGVNELENNSFRSTLIKAVAAAANRATELSKTSA